MLAGDFVTEGLGPVLASVCGEDTSLIADLIVMDYSKALSGGRLEGEPSYVWDMLVLSSTDFYPEEVYDRIVAAFDNGMVSEFGTPFHEVERVMVLGRETVLERLPKDRPVYVQDAVEELEW